MIYIVLECDRYQEKATKKIGVEFDNNGELELATDQESTMARVLANALLIEEDEIEGFVKYMKGTCKVSKKDNTFTFFGEETDYIIVGYDDDKEGN